MAQCVLKMQQACAVPGILCSAAAPSSAFYNNSCTSSSPQLLSLSACCNRTTPAATTTTTGGVKQQAWRLASSSSSSSSQIQGTCIIVVSQTIKLRTRRRCILSGRVLVPGLLLPSPRMRGTVCVYAEELEKGRQRERERESESESWERYFSFVQRMSIIFVVQINFHDCCSGSYVEDYIQRYLSKTQRLIANLVQHVAMPYCLKTVLQLEFCAGICTSHIFF